MIIYLSYDFRSRVVRGCTAVPASRQGTCRPASGRDARAHRRASRSRMPAVVRMLPGWTSDDLASPEGVSQRGLGRLAARRAVRVLPDASERARGVYGRAAPAHDAEANEGFVIT